MQFLSKKMILAVIVIGATEFVSGSAWAQTSREVQNKIQRLENEVQTLSRAVYKGEGVPAPVSGVSSQQNAAMEVRLQGLEQQIRNLTGMVERKSYETDQLQRAFDRFQADVNIRLQDVERGTSGSGGFSNGGAVTNELPRANAPQITGQRGMQYIPPNNNAVRTPQSLTGADLLNAPAGNAPSPQGSSLGQLRLDSAGSAKTVMDTPTALYESAFADLRAGDHGKAEDEFNTFLEKYPNHTLAENAEYWRAETHYVRGDFEGAARLFAQAYQKFPEGQKAPDNLLKLGLSLAGLGNNDDACVALGQLKKTHGASQSPVIQRGAQEMSRLGC